MNSSASARQIASLIQEAKQGQPDSLGELLERCRQYLLVIAAAQLPPPLTAKVGPSDLVQETFLKAHGAFGGFRGTTEPELLAWLRQILLNEVTTTLRLFQADKRHHGREISIQSESWVESTQEGVDLGAGPSQQVLLSERRTLLELAMALLPENYQQILLLRQQGDLTFSEIGNRLSCSSGAARKLWGRAVQRLEEALRAVGYEP